VPFVRYDWCVQWPLLATLSEADQREVLATTRRRRFGRGEVVVHEGDPADSLHLVVEGRLAVRVSTASGENATLNILGAGDYFGELSLLDGRTPMRSASIVALEPAETLSLSETAFRQLRQRHRGAEQLLLALLATRVEELSARLLETMYDGLDTRVCRRLLGLARVYADGADDAEAITIPLTQEQIAELVGGTRPSVNQVLQRLADRGVVELGRGRVTVLDRTWLEGRTS
jgi:CRP-like cAMP-binding protein